LPTAPTRIVQRLAVGSLVAVGFLGLFAVVGLPVSLGVGAIADAVPRVGLATGVALALTGLSVIAGRRREAQRGVGELIDGDLHRGYGEGRLEWVVAAADKQPAAGPPAAPKP